MFYPFKLYFRDRLVFYPILLSLCAEMYILWQIFSKINRSADQIFLHYNVVFGIDLIGAWWKILYLPLAGFIVVLLNVIIAWYFYGEDRFLSRFLSIFIAVFHALLVVGAVIVIGLNA